MLVKASAGGGGRGMRIVRTAGRAGRGVSPAAQREAAAAFGDATVFCERYVETGRHIEVQVFADTPRAPWSPWVSASARSSAGTRRSSRRRRRRRSVSRCGPGCPRPRCRPPAPSATSAPARSSSCSDRTATLLLPGDEHPAAGGAPGHRVRDRVWTWSRWQLLVAEGEPLPFTSATADAGPRDRGAAVRRGSGQRLAAVDRHAASLRRTDADTAFATAGRRRGSSGLGGGRRVGGQRPLRPDAGQGDRLGAHPATRRHAPWPRRLARAQVHGVVTNRDLLVQVLREPEFLDGDTDTAYPRPARRGLRAAARRRGRAAGLPRGRAGRRGPDPPRHGLGRLPGRLAQRARRCRSPRPTGSASRWSTRWSMSPTRSTGTAAWSTARTASSCARSRRTRSRSRSPGSPARTACTPPAGVSYVDGPAGSLVAGRGAAVRPRRRSSGRPARCSRRCRARSAGSLVEPGQRVAAGDLLLTLEAMKLEHAVYGHPRPAWWPTCPSGPAPRSTPAPSSPSSRPNARPRGARHELRLHPGTGAAARRGGGHGQAVRPPVLRREGEVGRAHRRAVGRGGQARLPRRQPADRVRRRRRRHHRARHRLRGAGRGRLPAAAAGRVAGHRRVRSSPGTAPRSSGPAVPAGHRRRDA